MKNLLLLCLICVFFSIGVSAQENQSIINKPIFFDVEWGWPCRFYSGYN